MEFRDLHRDVISQGLCTGCGSCVGICPTKGTAIIHIDHEPEPALEGLCNHCSLCYEICPGKHIPFPVLEKLVFGREKEPEKEPLGIYRTCLAGHAADEPVRRYGASGGVASALLIYALEQGLIDLALVGEMNPEIPWRTKPLAASSREEVLRAANTKKQVVATNTLIEEALKKGTKIGHVGVGCQVHSLRKLQLKYPAHKMSKALSFTLGLFCHDNYYTFATELLILERTGIESLEEVAKLEYRVGRTNFRVTSKDGQEYMLIGEAGSFIMLFRRNRCTMCLDWCNELADISLGDYWGPAIDGKDMKQGWSSIIVRTEDGENLIRDAENKGYLVTYPSDLSYLKFNGGFYQKKNVNVYNTIKRRHYNYPTPDFGRPLIVEPIKRPFDFGKAPYLKWLEEVRKIRSK